MKTIRQMKLYAILGVSLLFTLLACNSGDDLQAKKEQLKKYQTELSSLQSKIADLEKEISEASGESTEFLVTVDADTLKLSKFESTFSFQATVESDKNILVSSENPGLIKHIHVKEGQLVTAGQLLVSMDASLLETQVAEINKALELSESLYNKQKRLWEQNIGTELQYLESKNRFESLQKQKQSAQARIAKFYIKAPFAGKIDGINATAGSMISPGVPLLRLVDDSDIKIVAQVPETYIGKLKQGDLVSVSYPGLKTNSIEKIHSVSRVINADNRTFHVFIRPESKNKLELKPNLLAVVTATDFKADAVITVPTQILKRDSNNKLYLFLLTQKEGGNVVERRFVEVSKFDTDNSIIASGLKEGDIIIVKGYNSVDENDKVLVR